MTREQVSTQAFAEHAGRWMFGHFAEQIDQTRAGYLVHQRDSHSTMRTNCP